MIKLSRLPKPSYLTDEKVAELTLAFQKHDKNVWNHADIKTTLLSSSNNKCAYCECNLTEESKYMEVEHFEDKHNNSDKVVEWENLLPSCKRCNGSKGTHDVLLHPIVNPYIDNPSEHFSLRPYRLRHKTTKGENSIDVNDLNNTDRLVNKRFEIGNKLEETIENAKEKCDLFIEDRTTRRKNKFLNLMKDLLRECQPNSIYSATTSTVIHTNDIFESLVDSLKVELLWDEEIEELFNNSKSLVLDYI